MTPERFRRIKELFEAALDLTPGERQSFLDRETSGDSELRTALGALLALQGKDDSFLEVPPRLQGEPPSQVAPFDSLLDQWVGPYKVLSVLGRGGMGIVYLAEDTRLERKVALKALPAAFVGDSKREQRLRLEAKAAASLSHPNIATVYALEELDERLFIAGEYVDGVSLRQQLNQGTLDVPEVAAIADKIASGLSAAHAQGIIHRDLKPENVMRDREGEIKILDFGLAALLPGMERDAQRITGAGTILGTPAYMSPEQLLGESVDARSDIFSFGILLYELVSGENPFLGVTPLSTIVRLLEVTPQPISRLKPGAVALEPIIRTCLSKSADDRYESMSVLLSDLRALQKAESGYWNMRISPRDVEKKPRASGFLSPIWWVVHQCAVMLFYASMVYPVWRVNEQLNNRFSLMVFIGLLAFAAVNGTWRTHLLFTAKFNRRALAEELRGARKWLRFLDGSYAFCLLVAATLILPLSPQMAGFLAAVACGYAVVFLVVEPTTTAGVFTTREEDNQCQ